LRRGFLDGAPGLIISGLSAYSVLAKLGKLWELQRVTPASQSRNV
jgi:hypothetical protein